MSTLKCKILFRLEIVVKTRRMLKRQGATDPVSGADDHEWGHETEDSEPFLQCSGVEDFAVDCLETFALGGVRVNRLDHVTAY